MTNKKIVAPMTMIRRILMLMLGWWYVPKFLMVIKNQIDLLNYQNLETISFYIATLFVIYFVIRKD